MSFHSPTELQLPIRDVTVPAVGTFDRFTGQARYQLTGDEVRGSFIVAPETMPGSDACHVRVVYGDHPAQPQHERVDEPRIRRTRVRGECGPLAVDALPERHHLSARGQWVRSDGTLGTVPRSTHRYLAEVVHAVVTHWATRPNREGLIRAAARHAQQQPDIPAQATREVMERELDVIRAQIAPHWTLLQQLEAIAQADAPRLPVLPRSVHIDYLDPVNGTTGLMTALPRLNAHDGTITYTVTSGGRARGDFTVGPDRYSRDALPGGVSVQLGATPLLDGAGRENEPVVNGIRLRGSWNCTDSQSLTPALPAVIPGVQRADAPEQSVPASTAAWISTAIRALAIAYRDHSNVDALRLTAGKSRVDQLRQAPVQAVVELRRQESAAQARISAAQEAEAAYAALSA
ncbi:hypothetical protein ABZS96_26000 [Streptomyces avermitilis]|uniref:hypothetical protein n=1 Tax=Streptomyces avermitilis TaxID=33903 RepID=UPI00339E022F